MENVCTVTQIWLGGGGGGYHWGGGGGVGEPRTGIIYTDRNSQLQLLYYKPCYVVYIDPSRVGCGN